MGFDADEPHLGIVYFSLPEGEAKSPEYESPAITWLAVSPLTC